MRFAIHSAISSPSIISVVNIPKISSLIVPQAIKAINKKSKYKVMNYIFYLKLFFCHTYILKIFHSFFFRFFPFFFINYY